MISNTERDPLLSSADRDCNAELPSPALKLNEPERGVVVNRFNNRSDGRESMHRPGPLEITKSNRYAILAGIWVATFLSSLNSTLVATLLSSISSDFKKSNQASWLGTSYLLATCTFTPLYGRLCNILGRRQANQLAVLFAGLGTAACGLSQNMEMLIFARFLGGLGGGGILTTSTIILSDMYSMRSRGLAQGMGSIFNGLGMGLGGPVGGFISDRFGWRWAFLIQLPFFVLSIILTSYNLHYVTPGKSKSARDVLKKIDYAGIATLLFAVLSFLVFLSNKYNEDQSVRCLIAAFALLLVVVKQWSKPFVIIPLTLAVASFVLFVIAELIWMPEPMLAPFLLKQKIPVLVGISNFLVSNCNFAVTYFFPMWFETVALTSTSVAGAHLLPNSVSMSCGAVFAGWMMHRTGKYKLINLIFGLFPFIGATLLSFLQEDSGAFQKWFSIIPLGFGNAVVLQTTLIALLAHIPHSVMAVGTGFGQLFRGLGQVSGVGVASALFQYTLDRELRMRIIGDGSEEIITQIRHSSRLVASLPPHWQKDAQKSYAIALRTVFLYAASSTFLAYLVRLPIPEKSLDEPEDEPSDSRTLLVVQHTVSSETNPEQVADSEDDEIPDNPPWKIPPRQRLSIYESSDGGMDLESDDIGGSARSG